MKLLIFLCLFSISIYGQTNTNLIDKIIINNSTNVTINITINNTSPSVITNKPEEKRMVIPAEKLEQIRWEVMLEERRRAAFNQYLRRYNKN